MREFKNGDKELGLPKIDPYFYPDAIKISSEGGSIGLKIEGHNNSVIGLSTQNFKKVV